MNQIETARIIRDQDGNCDFPVNIMHCCGCPVKKLCGRGGWRIRRDGHEKVLKAINNWLAENDKENVMSDKIQMTEEQFREIALYINVNGMNDINHGLSKADIDSSIHDLKQAGYIKKSELQQKVEEVEGMYKEWEPYSDVVKMPNSTKNMLEKYHELIQLFKETHPEEFK